VDPVLISGPKRDYKTLKALAKGLRLAKRLTQPEAAALCGLTLANVRSIENGEISANFCYDYLFAIAQRRKRKSKRTGGGQKRAGNLRKPI
jgi:transcriptional regulator with XRE-family HTH domain